MVNIKENADAVRAKIEEAAKKTPGASSSLQTSDSTLLRIERLLQAVLEEIRGLATEIARSKLPPH